MKNTVSHYIPPPNPLTSPAPQAFSNNLTMPCRIPVFVELARRIVRHRHAIDAALEHGLSQGLIESFNTKIRLLTRIAFGFHSPKALIALAMLALGGHRPALPGRG